MEQQEKLKGKGCPIKWAVISGRSQLGAEQQAIVDGVCTLDRCAWFDAAKRDCRVNLWADSVMENLSFTKKVIGPMGDVLTTLDESSKALHKNIARTEEKIDNLMEKPPEGGKPS